MKYIIIALLLISMVGACPTDNEFKTELKKGLYSFLSNPETSTIGILEIEDMMIFYLENDVAMHNCSTVTGELTGRQMSVLLGKVQTIDQTVIPRCTDGTFYGDCSANKPRFCYSGLLREMCGGPDMIVGNSDDCGCPEYDSCSTDGTCSTLGISCYSDEDCGTNAPVGDFFCQDSNSYRQYIIFVCEEPGTSSAHCEYSYEDVLEQNCSTTCAGGSCS